MIYDNQGVDPRLFLDGRAPFHGGGGGVQYHLIMMYLRKVGLEKGLCIP